MTAALHVLVDDLCFPEGPRWRGDRLWFSDMHGLSVQSVTAAGDRRIEATVPARPSGLGWLPTGELLVVSMTDRRILAVSDTRTTTWADLSGHTDWVCNDMVVDTQGRAYVGNFGSGETMENIVATNLILARPDGAVMTVAEDMAFPNGTIITDDGRTLVVAESWARQLTAFDIAEDGTLHNRRVWAPLGPDVYPDGICLDTEGCIWVASPVTEDVRRIAEGGTELDIVATPRKPYACTLGGVEKRTLFICVADSAQPEEAPRLRRGQILSTEVSVPGADSP